MGAKRNPKETKDSAIAHWKAGRSQRWIADELGVSPASVNSWVKGIAQDNAELVNAQVAVKKELSMLSEQELNAVNEHVQDRTKHIQFFTNAAVRNVQEAMNAPCEGQADYQRRADTINKGREAVLGKTPDTAIQVNNNVQSATVSRDEYRLARAEIVGEI